MAVNSHKQCHIDQNKSATYRMFAIDVDSLECSINLINQAESGHI